MGYRCRAKCASADARRESSPRPWRPECFVRRGLAGALPFEDSSVDLVWCERVLQHLNDPHAAIDDIARVLRPGGRAILLDADQGTRIISDLDPDIAAAFVRASLAAVANPYAARRIPAQVRGAGLTLDPDVGSSAFIFSSEMLLRSQVVQRAADDAVESGGLARDVAQAAVGAAHAAAQRGEAFAAITVFGFIARKLDTHRGVTTGPSGQSGS